MAIEKRYQILQRPIGTKERWTLRAHGATVDKSEVEQLLADAAKHGYQRKAIGL